MTVLFSDMTLTLCKSLQFLSLQFTHVLYIACRGMLRNLGADSSKNGLHCITVTWQQSFTSSSGSRRLAACDCLKTPVAGNAARQWLLIALSHVLLYDVKRNLAANKTHFWDCCHNMGHFRCGVERVKCYVNVHLHCIVSSLKWASKMSTLLINGKISANAYACVVYVYNVTYALYCAINNLFCVIRVSFVATSQLACLWMCDSPRTGCAWRLTPTYMRRKYANIKAHKHGRLEDFFQWGPLWDFSKFF